MDDDKLTPQERITLKLMESAAKSGATDGELGALMAQLSGEKLVSFKEHCGGTVQVKPNRVTSVGGRRDGTTVIVFDGGKTQILVEHEVHKVMRDLREAGWDG